MSNGGLRVVSRVKESGRLQEENKKKELGERNWKLMDGQIAKSSSLIATGSGKPEMATSLIYSASHPLDPQIMRLSGDAASHQCAATPGLTVQPL